MARRGGVSLNFGMRSWRAHPAPFFLLAGLLLAGIASAAETANVVVLPEFPAQLVGRTPNGKPVEELEVYRLPLTALAQEQEAHAAAQTGIERALDEADPGAAIDHLASYLAVHRAAEKLAAQTPGAALPERDRFRGLLERRALEAWHDDRPGTALLTWILRDRVSRLPDDSGRDLVERSVEANDGWAIWRLRVIDELARIMPPSAGLGELGWTIPTWSPLLRHPHELLDNRPRPFAEAEAIRLNPPLRNAFRPAGGAATVLRIQAAAPRNITLPGHTEFLEKSYVPIQSTAFTAFEAAQKQKLAELDQKIAVAQARADREAPKVKRTETTRTLVGYEDRPMFQQALPFGAKPPGVRQGDLYRSGTVRVPIYEEKTITREVVDPNHPLNVAVRALRQERLAVVQREFPTALRNSVALNDRLLDQWLGTADVPVEVEAGNGPARFVLRVPFIRVAVRPRDRKAPELDAGLREWRSRAQDPAGDGAGDVHRAVAVWWNFQRLETRLGAELAAREAALLGEFGFGLRPDTGPVVARLREMFRPPSAAPSQLYQEEWRSGSALPAQAEPGAPVAAGEWPVPQDRPDQAPRPTGDFRLVHDPAVEREARTLIERLRAAGLSLQLEARKLPRTAALFPVLAFARTRAADLGVFLWRTVPEQTPALHDDKTADRELRLHAPVEQRSFNEGMAWILAHPSRFEEARLLARQLRARGGPNTLVEISVSDRGIVREGRPDTSTYAPDPESRWLRAFLSTAGLESYLPTDRLPVTPRRWSPADLVVVLRGLPGAPARGLPLHALKELGKDPGKLLLVANGSGSMVDAKITADTTLSLW